MIPTYQQQLDLVQKKLATIKYGPNGLNTFKYSRKTFYDNLWRDYPEVNECRGHTYDSATGQIVLLPPAKTFNYLERNTWSQVPLDTEVSLYRKYNGFMASVSIYQGEYVVGTTGTTSSDFAKLARSNLEKDWFTMGLMEEGYTYLFEIVDQSDPHIIDERPDAYFLGKRSHTGDTTFRPSALSIEYNTTLGKALELAKTIEHEGWMCYNRIGGVCKIKTDYYIGKKKLMRMTDTFVEQMFSNPTMVNNKLPDRWKNLDICHAIVENHTVDDWKAQTDQERRWYLEYVDKECKE